MKKQLILNADVGEGMRNDANLIPYLTYANIACGGHFGNETTITDTIGLAKINNIKVGAHPSYPDQENFGRKSMEISKEALSNCIKAQIDFFLKQCRALEVEMHHIKLHGALYNDIFNNQESTRWFLNWVELHYPRVSVFVPIGAKPFISEMKNTYIIEAFADRQYTADLNLVSRSNPKAVLNSKSQIKKQVLSILNGEIQTLNKSVKNIEVDTVCVHGDHPMALEIAKELHALAR